MPRFITAGTNNNLRLQNILSAVAEHYSDERPDNAKCHSNVKGVIPELESKPAMPVLFFSFGI